MLPIVADVYGVLGGLFLTWQILVGLHKSYKTGRISTWRVRRRILQTQNMISKLKTSGEVDDNYPSLDQYVRDLKITQIQSGSEPERLEAINYVRHLGPDSRIDIALENVICLDKANHTITTKALEVLHERRTRV